MDASAEALVLEGAFTTWFTVKSGILLLAQNFGIVEHSS